MIYLIHKAYGISEDVKYSTNHRYVWKGVVMMCGVYLFYLVEKIIKIMILRKKLMKKRASVSSKSFSAENPQILETIGYFKRHEQDVEPNIELRVHLSDQV